MDNNISFSFVMPAYKKRFLYYTIDSILKQTYQNFEVIIVNDRSPEDLDEVVQQFSDERIRYIVNETNIGGKDLVSNWNHCINFANNNYIILATDDDTYEPVFLSEAVRLITKYPNVNLIRSGVKKVDENDFILDYEFPTKEFMTSGEFSLYWAKGSMISCISNYIFKTEALLKIGGFITFPHGHFSDDATALTMAEYGVACSPNNYMNFRVSSINLSNQGNYKLAIDQVIATDHFVTWYLNHVNKQANMSDHFYYRACYGGCKNKCITLIEKLIVKIPIYKSLLAIKVLFSIKNLFKKERLKLLTFYFINKL